MSPLPVTERPNLIIGCGYLGRRVAARWHAAGRQVAALTRGNAEALADLGIEPITGDVLEPASLARLPAAATVLHAVGLDRSSGRSMREVYVTGLSNVLNALPDCERFVFVSSTSVYGQTDGNWVDEAAAAEPAEESGRIVLEAERMLRSRRPDAIVLRFGGIYGPDRLMRKHLLLKGEPLVGDAERWLNLIHVEDGADAVLAAEVHGTPGETYNIVDDEPTTRRGFYTHFAGLLLAPPATFEHRPEPGTTNRRIHNDKAKTALKWQPRYPSFREGLEAM